MRTGSKDSARWVTAAISIMARIMTFGAGVLVGGGIGGGGVGVGGEGDGGGHRGGGLGGGDDGGGRGNGRFDGHKVTVVVTDGE